MTDGSANATSHAARPRRLVLIFNPAAGRRHHGRLPATLEALRGLGCSVDLRETQGPGDAEILARRLDPGSADVVVVAGGDGTINEAINGLTGRGARQAPLPLAIVPLGTANVLAAEIGLGASPAEIARTIAAGATKTIYLGRAGGRVFTMMAGVGFDAHVVAHVDKALKLRIGKGAYLWQTLRQFFAFSFPCYSVTLDGQTRDVASVIVAKGHFYGGRYVCAPQADLAAPSFEVCLFERPGPWNALRYAAALGLGRLSQLPDVRIVTARQVRIEGPEDDPVQGDGDVIGRLPISIDVLPDGLQIVVPAPAS